MAKSRRRRPGDPQRRPRMLGPVNPTRCGCCSQKRSLSRTHHPPQAVGNTHEVRRFDRRSTPDRMLIKGRQLPGGLHFKGLCGPCNTEAGDRWDGGYGELHEALGPAYFANTRLVLPGAKHRPARTPVRVGAAVRSMLAAALGLNPRLRLVSPQLPDLVRSGDPFRLPEDLDLRLALAIGRRARITGGVSGLVMFGPQVDGQPIGNTTVAQSHYAPVAWHLMFRHPVTLCDIQGWPSIAHWTELTEDQVVMLADVCDPLPRVRLPQDDPTIAGRWAELFANEAAFMVESDDIAPPPRPPRHSAA